MQQFKHKPHPDDLPDRAACPIVSLTFTQTTFATMSLTKRQFGAAALGALLAARAPSASAAPADPCVARPIDVERATENLKRAYPDFIEAAKGNEIIWKDGTRMPVRLFPAERTPAEKLENPDLAAQLMQFYPAGDCALPSDPAQDPGRIRYTPFFSRMYGQQRQDVEASLVSIPWPGRHPGTTIAVTRVNGVSDRLRAVAAELAALPKAFHRVFDTPAGGFYWRPIAGTNRLSAHSFGIAVDINVSVSHYWRNELGGAAGEPPAWKPDRARNRIPREVVEIFERHGFIWGGKWFHYDTMHFEYRPELLLN